MQPSFFDVPAPYPIEAGWKATDTSREAAATVDAATVRAVVEAWLTAHGPHTADEVAAGLKLSVLTVRPRCTELRRLHRILDSGVRRPNFSGRMAIVWQVKGMA